MVDGNENELQANDYQMKDFPLTAESDEVQSESWDSSFGMIFICNITEL